MSWHWIVNIGAGGLRHQERCSLMVRISISCMDVRCSDEEMTGKPWLGNVMSSDCVTKFVQPFEVECPRTLSGMKLERCPRSMLRVGGVPSNRS